MRNTLVIYSIILNIAQCVVSVPLTLTPKPTSVIALCTVNWSRFLLSELLLVICIQTYTLHTSLKIGLYKRAFPFEVSLGVTAGGDGDGCVFSGCCYQMCTVAVLPLYWLHSMGPSQYPEEHGLDAYTSSSGSILSSNCSCSSS
jgi:hypothetical protein